MMDIYTLDQIKSVLADLDPLQSIEDGFVAYSQGKTVIPPVGELLFTDPPGDMHIKYGCIKGDDYYVVKIASGFYNNPQINLPSFNGLMLVFSQKTGVLRCILLDEGHLTNIRTAAAGAVAAKYLAPKNVNRIGVLGAGIQGRMQVEYLRSVTACMEVLVWGISQEELDNYQEYMENQGYSVNTTLSAEDIASCKLIITSTPAKSPLLKLENIQSGTHITAMGSDTSEKQELDPLILQKADIVVADSLSQCRTRGEIFKALEGGILKEDKIVELGNVIMDSSLQRSSGNQITVADLTGVAIQDIQIAKAVYEALKRTD